MPYELTAASNAIRDRVHPYARWRRVPPHCWRPLDLSEVKEHVFDLVTPLREPRWAAACAGEAAAAIGVAIAWDRPGTPPLLSDAVLSTLVAPALAGDGAAICVLLTKLAGRLATDPECRPCYEAWKAYSDDVIRRACRERRSRRTRERRRGRFDEITA